MCGGLYASLGGKDMAAIEECLSLFPGALVASILSISGQGNEDLWSDGHERQDHDVLSVGQYFAGGFWSGEGGNVVDGRDLAGRGGED